jgi:hypothetical protein
LLRRYQAAQLRSRVSVDYWSRQMHTGELAQEQGTFRLPQNGIVKIKDYFHGLSSIDDDTGSVLAARSNLHINYSTSGIYGKPDFQYNDLLSGSSIFWE